jgi:hypothetical protein
MSIPNPNIPRKKGGTHHKIILRSQIEEAQRHTNSNRAASRWLQVDYKTYKKYADLYGLFEQHKNPTGIGVDKGFSKRPTSIPLRDVLAGNHPKYSLAKLKNRLIARRKIHEACTVCGFNERRITDYKMPLMLTFIDGNKTNFSLNNLELRCYNCMFLTTGAPSVVHRSTIPASLRTDKQPRNPLTIQPDIITADYYDPTEDIELHDIELTEAERQELLDLIS